MRYLSLFSGAEGGGLAFQRLIDPPIRCVGYVENNKYCQKILRRRIADGYLHDAPVFAGVRRFISQGYAEAYKGMVEIVAAGWPCKPYSKASRGRAKLDDLWPLVVATARTIGPKFIFCENVRRDAIEAAAKDLFALGYLSKAIKISAADLGADHIRARFWLCSYADDARQYLRAYYGKMAKLPELQKGIWKTGPGKRRIFKRLARRMERFKAIGNGQLPIMACAAWYILTNEIIKGEAKGDL